MLDPDGFSLVRRALSEDLAGYGDVTSAWTVPLPLRGKAVITARQELVVCGLPLAEEVLRQIDPVAGFVAVAEDGAFVHDGDVVARIEGPARGILSAERTMLNFLTHLSGVATQARHFADAVEGTRASVVDTRKTTPGLRLWEKRAVVRGGCRNHRFGLFDLVLIKNNHLTAAGGVREAVRRAQELRPHYIKIEVEVESESDLREAIACGADVVMLDNRDLGELTRLVLVARELKPDVMLEASGGIRLDTVRAVAETGVDLVSTSALTMGAPAADLALTLDLET
jgi:nicotinate-nucleotide pyrophosphorylase (carboxylating)